MSKRTSTARVRTLVALLVLGLALVFLEKSGTLNTPKSLFASVFNPVQLALYRTYQNVSQVGFAFFSIGSLHQKNISLEIENAELKSENSRLSTLEKDNEILREQLGAPRLPLRLTQIANVIGFGTSGNRNNLLIDKGSTAKVHVGDLVVVKNIYIGRVAEVSPKVARVQLITDPSTKIAAVTTQKALGVLEGQFGTESHLTNVIQDDKLAKGDLVFTSGEGGLPKGMVLGEITEVKKVSRELFQDATVTSPIDLAQLQVVFVMEEK